METMQMLMDKVYEYIAISPREKKTEHNGKMCAQKSGDFNESWATWKF